MDSTQLRKHQQQKQEVAQCDPLTLVAAARSDLYQKGGGGGSSPWIEEVITRFEQQHRAGLGATSPVFAGIGSSS